MAWKLGLLGLTTSLALLVILGADSDRTFQHFRRSEAHKTNDSLIVRNSQSTKPRLTTKTGTTPPLTEIIVPKLQPAEVTSSGGHDSVVASDFKHVVAAPPLPVSLPNLEPKVEPQLPIIPVILAPNLPSSSQPLPPTAEIIILPKKLERGKVKFSPTPPDINSKPVLDIVAQGHVKMSLPAPLVQSKRAEQLQDKAKVLPGPKVRLFQEVHEQSTFEKLDPAFSVRFSWTGKRCHVEVLQAGVLLFEVSAASIDIRSDPERAQVLELRAQGNVQVRKSGETMVCRELLLDLHEGKVSTISKKP